MICESSTISKRHRLLPFRHPLRVRRRNLEISRNGIDNSSAYLGVQFARAVTPHLIFVISLLMLKEGTIAGEDIHVIPIILGFWVACDLLVRWTRRRRRLAQKNLEAVEADIERELSKADAEVVGVQSGDPQAKAT